MTVSEQIIAVIDELCKKFGIAVDWTAANVLPYLQTLCDKFIKYEIVTSVAWMILPLVLLAIFIPVTAILHKRAMALEGKNYHSDTAYDIDYAVTWFTIISWICLVISALWAVISLISQSIDIIEAITFPEKMIFEYISGIMSKGN